MTASVQGSLHAGMVTFLTLCAVAHHSLCVSTHGGLHNLWTTPHLIVLSMEVMR